MILKFLLNTQMIWMIFMKILKNAAEIRNTNYKLIFVFDDLIADMLSNKKLQQTVAELFIEVGN